jgi:hypothetical protein
MALAGLADLFWPVSNRPLGATKKQMDPMYVYTTVNSGFARVFQSLPRVIPSAHTSFAENRAQHNNNHGVVTFAEGPAVCRQVGTLGRNKSLPRASSWQGRYPRRRNEHRDIWVAVHCADGSTVGPSAKTHVMSSVAT